MRCKICNQENNVSFQQKILNKYQVNYYHCSQCGFLQTQEPYWLEEAYNESINETDTGIMSRNIYLSKITTAILFIFFDKNKKFLDFAGGYGLFVRLMRDVGFDFFWNDKYSTNFLARGFEYNSKDGIELVTSFETFEHFVNPMSELENILAVSKNILFSTNLIKSTYPKPGTWWYYGLEHGQHVSFYSLETLTYIAAKYDLNLYSNGNNIHLLTEKKINRTLFVLMLKGVKLWLFKFRMLFLKPKMISDMEMIIDRRNK